MSRYIYLIWMLGIAISTNGQSVIPQELIGHLTSSISRKSRQYEQLLEKRTTKMLRRMEHMEQRMHGKLMKQDSLAAKRIFDSSLNKIHQLQTGWTHKIVHYKNDLPYNNYLDTLHSTLQFLSASAALKKVDDLETRIQQADQVQTYIKLHKEQLKQQLSKYTNLSGSFKHFNQAYTNYSAQVTEYKSYLKDRKKATIKALEMLKKIPAYQDFISKNERFASLFNAPAEALPGMQTREQVQQMMSERLATGGNENFNDPLNAAQSRLTQIQQRLPPWRSNTSEMDMPDYKPNMKKTKRFLQRLEYGFNLQPQQSGKYLPGMMNIGASLGYQINEKSVAGIGIAYQLGMGQPIKSITFSNQGIGLRSYLDVKLKGSIFISGGMEYNYMHAFTALQRINLWQRSGLIGITRKIKIGNKELKTQLLWDLLSYNQVPQTTAFKFRTGYNFN